MDSNSSSPSFCNNQLKKLVVLISGNGTNLQAIIGAIDSGILPNTCISAVICNKKDANGLSIAQRYNIPAVYLPKMLSESRDSYDEKLALEVHKHSPDLIVLAGWMRILSNQFIYQFQDGKIINLHPALPNQFPGANSIADAFEAYQNKLITHTGIMVHTVVEQIDAGKVLQTKIIPISPDDTLPTLTKKVTSHEKMVLIKAIYQTLFDTASAANEKESEHVPHPHYSHPTTGGKLTPDGHQSTGVANSLTNHISQPQLVCDYSQLVKKGKVRNIYDVEDGTLLLAHTDRLSCFDRHICDINGKGYLLCILSSWWFKHTQSIIPNHYIWHKNNVMCVKKCTPIPLEIVVRDYITGNTNTSLWTHYSKGERTYCGIELPSNLTKNQKLPQTIITPTSKSSDHDVPLSVEDIIGQKIVNIEEWTLISKKAMELFKFGVSVAKEHDLILADTKYEFGWDENHQLVLIDEIHTPDSSRFWNATNYTNLFKLQQEPQKLDKDGVRDYLMSLSDFNPYDVKCPTPVVPDKLKDQVHNSYAQLVAEFI